MNTLTYQPALRPALPTVYGPLEYRETRALYERIDHILRVSGLEQEFINLALSDQKINLTTTSAKQLECFANFSVMALRANIARNITGLAHRPFCVQLADSTLLPTPFSPSQSGSLVYSPPWMKKQIPSIRIQALMILTNL